jgi:hypothetical protein
MNGFPSVLRLAALSTVLVASSGCSATWHASHLEPQEFTLATNGTRTSSNGNASALITGDCSLEDTLAALRPLAADEAQTDAGVLYRGVLLAALKWQLPAPSEATSARTSDRRQSPVSADDLALVDSCFSSQHSNLRQLARLTVSTLLDARCFDSALTYAERCQEQGWEAELELAFHALVDLAIHNGTFVREPDSTTFQSPWPKVFPLVDCVGTLPELRVWVQARTDLPPQPLWDADSPE